MDNVHQKQSVFIRTHRKGNKLNYGNPTLEYENKQLISQKHTLIIKIELISCKLKINILTLQLCFNRYTDIVEYELAFAISFNGT